MKGEVLKGEVLKGKPRQMLTRPGRLRARSGYIRPTGPPVFVAFGVMSGRVPAASWPDAGRVLAGSWVAGLPFPASWLHFVMSRLQFPVSRLKLQAPGVQFSEFEFWMSDFGDEFELPLQFWCDFSTCFPCNFGTVRTTF